MSTYVNGNNLNGTRLHSKKVISDTSHEGISLASPIEVSHKEVEDAITVSENRGFKIYMEGIGCKLLKAKYVFGSEQMAELNGHTSRVLYMTQSPDGCTVASAAADETLSLDSTSALGIVQMLHDIAVVCIYQFKGRVVNVGFKRLEKSLSFFGFAARKAVSATAFTVTGVVNKFLTVAINVTIWDKHASPAGLVCLLFTIIGGVLYQQSVTGNCSMLSV
ncbi:hypothetical protein KIW84_075872 [Lathyrus oleraceus]|uniref:Uncharacterized protein n=1 Tax=Pisum sativum TaxID=3888 RepID=A0A9D5A2I5_PEA|nr:hypothetical protein KIW84_075872 [Pisum sativum]